MELLKWAGTPEVPARANWGRWVVDCPACPSALTLPPAAEAFTCWDCGARAEVRWPDAEFVAGVERLLSMRPAVETRNWHPGETLHDLLAENVEHGVMSALVLAAGPGTGQVLEILGGRITTDRLPEQPNRLHLPTSVRAALEA